jgi:hypothetical protein
MRANWTTRFLTTPLRDLEPTDDSVILEGAQWLTTVPTIRPL